jgi:hypothetical protein
MRHLEHQVLRGICLDEFIHHLDTKEFFVFKQFGFGIS